MENNKIFGRDFTLVVIGQIISLFGNAILRFALPLYLLKMTGSAALFGAVTACSFLPMIVMSLLGGVLADRVNKRNIMVVLDFITAGIICVLVFLLDIVPLVPLLIVALMLLYGISGTYQPAVQASVPALVGEAKLLRAGAVINQVGALASLLGPMLGGVLFKAFGIVPILAISIVCFAASAIMEIFIRIPHVKIPDKRGILQIVSGDLRESFQYMRREKPVLIKIILLIAAFNFALSSMMIVGIPVLLVEILKIDDGLFGLSQGIMALGGLFGGILTAALGDRLKYKSSRFLLLGCSICAGTMALPFLFPAESMTAYIIITAASFAIMTLATIFSVQTIAIIQKSTPPRLVGKVIACAMALAMCAQPLGQAIYGLAFEKLASCPGIILLLAAISALAMCAASAKLFAED
ncbi:MAG: MFS transporter [Oscillospiraceae bacterium]